MTWSLEWTEWARRDLQRPDRQTAERVIRAVDRRAETEQGDVRRLEHVRPPEWRLRVGDWRVRFTFDCTSRTLAILHVLARGAADRD